MNLREGQSLPPKGQRVYCQSMAYLLCSTAVMEMDLWQSHVSALPFSCSPICWMETRLNSSAKGLSSNLSKGLCLSVRASGRCFVRGNAFPPPPHELTPNPAVTAEENRAFSLGRCPLRRSFNSPSSLHVIRRQDHLG